MGALQGQAGDPALVIEDNPAEALASGEGQGDFHHGVLAELAGRWLARALEAADGAGRVCPPLGDTAGVHRTAHGLVEFPAYLFPAALGEVAEQGTCPVSGIGRDIGH
jgi:hypothetical protein